MGGEGEGSGVKGGGKWGERGREVGVGYPPVHPLIEMRQFYFSSKQVKHDVFTTMPICSILW